MNRALMMAIALCVLGGCAPVPERAASREGPTEPDAPTMNPNMVAEKLASAYDGLFHDEKLIAQGVLGWNRVMHPVIGAHLLGNPYTAYLLPDGKERVPPESIREFDRVRKESGEDWMWESGLLAVESSDFVRVRARWSAEEMQKPLEERVPQDSVTMSPVVYWSARSGPASLFHDRRGRAGSEDARLTDYAKRVHSAMSDEPGQIHSEEIAGWRMYARTIPFRKPMCLECHPGKKVGDPAAIVSIALKRKEPESPKLGALRQATRTPGPN